jgi:ubiquitin carboxyl-terminal hydrolase 5/13
VTGARGAATSTRRLASAPRYLWVVLNRYLMAADWTPKKVDAAVDMPLTLDLRAAGLLEDTPAGELRPGEVSLDALAAAAAPAGAAAAAAAVAAAPAPASAAPAPDAAIVAALESMGFPAGACARAALAVANAGVEQASEWIMARMDDDDFAAPFVPPAPAAAAAAAAPGAAPDAAALAALTDMGFDAERAAHALRVSGGNADRAADWLFSHVDEPLPDAAAAAAAAGGGAPAVSAPVRAADAAPNARGRYSLLGFISHMGSNTASGHYVAHIRKAGVARADGAGAGVGAGVGAGSGAGPEWLIFNDAKVAFSAEPPLDSGYMYLYARDD